ncbi:MAG: dihydrodipicolinate synthase family protein [Litorilinea sp.]|nr:MAG: dihydrodipicolinate synthase family protein [Litorilinea sp.]
MQPKDFRGVFAILVTPFDEQGAIDQASLRRCVNFCIDGGARGIVTPVNASEATTLTDEERIQVASIVVEEAGGRVPVVIGVSGTSTEHAVYLAKKATQVGADALIAMPPYVRKGQPTDDEIFMYYRSIATMAKLPVIVQDYVPPIGTPLPNHLLLRLFQEIDEVQYLKEETALAGQKMTALLKANVPIQGIMGGAAGRHLLDEYRRGAVGTMPACEIIDLHAQLWDLLEAGKMEAARDFYMQLLPLLNIESQYSFAVYKEVLRRRGIIATTFSRMPGAPRLDRYDHLELDAILSRLKPLFRL